MAATPRLALPLLLLLTTLTPALAAAQGLAGGLDDPTGRTPPRARPARAPTDGLTDVPPPPDAVVTTTIPAPPPDDGSQSSAAILTRMRALDASLASLAASGGPDYLRAILSLLAGGAGIAIGAVVLDIGEPYDRMAPYFMVLGGTTILRTIFVEFVLPPDARGPAIEYQAMPSGTHRERLARLEYGEQQLEHLAERSMITRVVDGSINIAGALAIIPAYLAPRDFKLDSELEALIFIAPAIALIGGIVTLASPSGAEQRWNAYRQLRDRLGQQAALESVREWAERPSVRFDVAATPFGGAATVGGRF